MTLPPLGMTPLERSAIATVAHNLRMIAREIVTTAIGSSRIAMYKELAGQLQTEADALDELSKDRG
jgi:hypothetical protein